MLMPLAAERAMLASVSSSVSTHLIFGVVVRVSSVVFSRVCGCAGVFYVLFPAAYLDDDALDTIIPFRTKKIKSPAL